MMMNRKSLSLVLVMIASLMLVGCLPERVVGIYDSVGTMGIDREMVWIKKDGELLWSPLSKTKDDFVRVGMLEVDVEKKEANLVLASAHPYLGTGIDFSDDFRVVEIEWKRQDGGVANRATKFKKRE